MEPETEPLNDIVTWWSRDPQHGLGGSYRAQSQEDMDQKVNGK